MGEEANKVEALLFSSARKMSEEELSKLTGIRPEQLKQALEELRRKHESEDSPLILLNEGDSWKLMTKEKYLSLIQNIVTETELDKSLMETLAVIAWKYPILQADVIKLRNNKAYDHLRELEEAGFIVREKKGRTRSIRLTPKFFEYFDLPPSKAKTQEAFKEIVPQDIREGIEKTESEINKTEQLIEERKKQKEETEKKMREEKEKKKQDQEKEVDLVDDVTGKSTKLDIYQQKPQEKKQEKEKLGMMDVYGGEGPIVPGESRISESAAEKRAKEIEKEETTPEVEVEIEKMLHPKSEEPEKPVFGEENVEELEGAIEESSKEEPELKKEEEELMPKKKEAEKEEKAEVSFKEKEEEAEYTEEQKKPEEE